MNACAISVAKTLLTLGILGYMTAHERAPESLNTKTRHYPTLSMYLQYLFSCLGACSGVVVFFSGGMIQRANQAMYDHHHPGARPFASPGGSGGNGALTRTLGRSLGRGVGLAVGQERIAFKAGNEVTWCVRYLSGLWCRWRWC